MKRSKAAGSESITELEARLANMKKAQTEKRPRGRPKGSKNKPKTDTAGDTSIDTPADSDTKQAVPSKPSKPAKEPKSSKAKPQAKPRGRQAAKAKGITEVPWKHEHELTDHLLTAIELNGPRRQAFGFTKGDLDTAGNTTSQTQDAHCERLAFKILVDDPSGRWDDIDPKDLVSTVRSRIATLKTDYQRHKNSLGETGFGLVMEDREGELYGDPQNVWEKIEDDFPWFKRMHSLLDGSPVHDSDACTNSSDSLDPKLFASILNAEISQDDAGSISMVDDGLDAGSTADIDIGSDDDSKAPSTARKAMVKTEKVTAAAKPAGTTKPVPKPTVGAAPKCKRDTMLDTLKDIVGKDHESKVELLELSHKAKHRRTEMELEHKAAEAEKTRAHGIEKLKLQIQLAQINNGNGAQMSSMHTSERRMPFRTDDTSLFGSGRATPYSTSNASGFDHGESLSSSNDSGDNMGLSFDMYNTYHTQNETPYRLPSSSSSAA
ncbi:hypothetical protein B0H16DRAFT_1791714 [Mycena metata]|uniref:Uncharacterized protein n=1 Tax=Mycena metata TaxID=1033252 RepID=A0AAD7HI22_9AGAR|nr:hypothetical protein B0H16DRAFT_1791714 [Mycena metata]